MLQRSQPVDRDYRRFLIRVSPQEVGDMFRTCFAAGPRPGGSAEALHYFEGNPQHPAILSTVPVVEECDRYMPGLSLWLNRSSFGNDLDMIKAFARWYEIGVSREQISARQHT